MAFPIVPTGEARLRLQPSADHTDGDIDLACGILVEEARRTGLL